MASTIIVSVTIVWLSCISRPRERTHREKVERTSNLNYQSMSLLDCSGGSLDVFKFLFLCVAAVHNFKLAKKGGHNFISFFLHFESKNNKNNENKNEMKENCLDLAFLLPIK